MAKNISLSVIAQAISLTVSFLMNLIVPKFIPVDQYALWQSFSLYASYVSILHFGLLDGIVLRYSQYDFDEIDKTRLSWNFQSMLTWLSLCAAIAVVIGLVFCTGVNRTIVILVGVSIVTTNCFTYNSYLLQITNRIKGYAGVVIVQRLVSGIIVAFLILVGIQHFVYFCLAFIFGDIIASLVSLGKNSGSYFSAVSDRADLVQELSSNLSAGVKLLIANWASMFLLGSAKMIVQWKWGLLTFGRVSFSFSITQLFLSVIVPVSIVLFPSIKRMDEGDMRSFYVKIRDIISPLLILVLVLYFPGCMILEKWLPKYSESLSYLGILLPIIVYSSKVSLLTNNYLKAYRLEDKMLMVNLLSIAIAISGFIIFAYWIENLSLLLVWALVSVMIKSLLSEIIVTKKMTVNITVPFIAELVIVIIFLITAKFMSYFNGFLLYSGCALVYSILYYLYRKNGHLCNRSNL